MYDDMLSKWFANPQALPNIMGNVGQLTVSNLEKLTALQMSALQSYMNLGLEQVKSVTQVTDLNNLQDLYKQQTAAANSVQQQLLADVKALSDWSSACKAEWDNVLKECVTGTGVKAAA
jgi:phasin family protein